MPTLKITRPAEWMNIFRDYHIYLDNRKVGAISNHSSQALEIEPGTHELQFKIDWCSSPKFRFKAMENEEKKVQVSSFKGTKWGVPFLNFLAILLIALSDFFEAHWYVGIPVAMVVLAGIVYPFTLARKRYLRTEEIG